MSRISTCLLAQAVMFFFVGLLVIRPAYAETDSATASDTEIELLGEASRFLKSIEIVRTDRLSFADELIVEYPSEHRIIVRPELGDSMKQLVVLHPQPDSDVVFRIEQRYETSLTVMNEGPHLDLIGWKHHVSEWQELEPIDSHSFMTKEAESSEFPDVRRHEIVEAVTEKIKEWDVAGERWIELAGQCESPMDYPCGVSISKITLRLSVHTLEQWEEILRIDFLIPMGC